MKKQVALTILTASAIAVTSALPVLTQTEVNLTSQLQFFCTEGYDPDLKQYIPTTFAQRLQDRKTAIIRWRSDWFKRTGWDQEARCQEVALRFQEAYQEGMLEYLTHGRMNHQSVICATRNYGGSCQKLILTLKPQDNPIQVLNLLNSTFNGAAGTVINQSTGESQVYIHFDVQEFVNRASGKE